VFFEPSLLFTTSAFIGLSSGTAGIARYTTSKARCTQRKLAKSVYGKHQILLLELTRPIIWSRTTPSEVLSRPSVRLLLSSLHINIHLTHYYLRLHYYVFPPKRLTNTKLCRPTESSNSSCSLQRHPHHHRYHCRHASICITTHSDEAETGMG
jgi:hypothetical protein